MTYLLKRKSVIFFHREEYLIVGLNSKKIDQKKATYQKSKDALTILLKIKKKALKNQRHLHEKGAGLAV
jgi:hypothetical protein